MKKGVYKQLNLPHLEVALPQLLEQARREQWTYETMLERALAAELDGCDAKATARRLTAARFPGKKSLDRVSEPEVTRSATGGLSTGVGEAGVGTSAS